jgi:hypothetical protein
VLLCIAAVGALLEDIPRASFLESAAEIYDKMRAEAIPWCGDA